MKKLMCWAVGLVWILTFSAYAAEKIDFTDPNKAISVSSSSPEVTLKIKSNPTTGYSWFLMDYDHDVLKPISREYVAPEKNLVGASGYEVWHFKVNASAFVVPQMTHITLQYARPWVAPTADRKLAFTVVINPNSNHKQGT